MNQAVTTMQDNAKLVEVLINSLYPNASRESALMVIDYCRAAGLDVMQKPVHIVPMWDGNAGRMRDVVMPGISLYRVNAARSKLYGGVTDPEFGPDVTETIGGVTITFPQWCRVVAYRITESGTLAAFPALERWKENYAAKGGKEKSIAPNAMWSKRPYAQLAKCAEAQALRKAFPESCPANTAEEMEGKQINDAHTAPIDSGPAVVLISDEQAQKIRAALDAAGKTEDALCKKCRVAAIEEIEASRFDAVLGLIGTAQPEATHAAE